MLPPSVAAIVECETDSKQRTLQVLRDAAKYYGATVTPTAYMFERKGKLVYENKSASSEEEVLDRALEAGAEDVEYEEDGTFTLWTGPQDLTSVAQAFNETATSQDFVWAPKEDAKVEIDSENTADTLSKLLARLEDDGTVQEVYLNTR